MVVSMVAMATAGAGMAVSDDLESPDEPTIEQSSVVTDDDLSAASPDIQGPEDPEYTVSDDDAVVPQSVQDANGETDLLVSLEGDVVDLQAVASGEISPEQAEQQLIQTQSSAVTEMAALSAVEVNHQYWLGNTVSITVDLDQTSIDEIAAIDEVKAVSLDLEPQHPAPVDVDVEPEQDHGDFTFGLDQINLPEYEDNFDELGDDTTVAILDDGLIVDHPDIDPALVGTAIDGSVVEGTIFPGSHGTHVAGTAVGALEPAGDAPRYGVAPNATLIAADVLSQGNDVTAAMQWAVANGADVIGGSFGVPPADDRNTYSVVREEIMSDIRDAGVVVSISSGNSGNGAEGGPVTSPAAEFSSVSVGASTDDGNIATFSSGGLVAERTSLDYFEEYGPDAPFPTFPDEHPHEYIAPDVSAPGQNVFSAGPLGGDVTEDPFAYSFASGTSMAQPHFAGAVALVQSATDAQLSAEEIEAALIETAVNPNDNPRDIRYGSGIIDVVAAVDHAQDQLRIDGQVTDNETGEPLVGAAVETEMGQVVTTDENGEYTLFVDGDVTVTADEFGYTAQSQDVTFGNGAAATVDFSVGTESVTAEDQHRVGVQPLDFDLGDVTESGNVTIDDAVAIQRESLGLDPGVSPADDRLFNVNRNLDNGSEDVSIRDAVLAQRISLGIANEKNLQVTNLDAPAQATVGEVIEVSATINNTGNIGAIEPAEFQFDGTVLDESVLDVGAAPTGQNEVNVTFALDTSGTPEGTFTHGIFTEDDNATAQIELIDAVDAEADFDLEPEVDVRLVQNQAPFAEIGSTDTVEVEATQLEALTVEVNETASTVNANNVRVRLDGQRILGDTVEFGTEPGERFEGFAELTIETTSTTAPDTELVLDHTFEGPNDSEVTVSTGPTVLREELEPANFELSDLSVPAEEFPVGDVDYGTIEVTVTNTGEVTDTQAVEWFAGPVGLVSPPEFTLEPGESTTVSTGGFDLSGFFPEPTADIQGFQTEDDIVAEPFTVFADGDSYFDVAALDAPEQAGVGEEITVTAFIQNLGTEADEQLADFRFAGQLIDGEEVELEAYSETTLGPGLVPVVDPSAVVTFTATLPEEAGTYEHGVETEDDSLFADIEVVETSGTVFGTVTDDALGEPVEGVTIEAEDQEGGTFQDVTDENGEYELELPAGTYVINPVDTPEGYSLEAIVTVEPGDSIEQNFTVSADDPSLTGTVTNAVTGEPIEDAEVFDADEGEFSVMTDADGEYTISAGDLNKSVGETIAVRANADDFDRSNIRFLELGPGENTLDLTLEPQDADGVLTFDDQATASSTFTQDIESTPGVGVTDVAANFDGALVVTYQDQGDLIIAGLDTFTASEADGDNMFNVSVEDAGGFPGEHTAHIIPADDLSGEYAPGDTVSQDTASAVVDSEAATVFQGTVEFEDQTVVNQADDGDLTVNASLADGAGDDTLYVVDVHPTDDEGNLIGPQYVGTTDVLSGSVTDEPLQLEDQDGNDVTIDETDDFVAMIHIVDDDANEGDSVPPGTYPVLPHASADGEVPGGVTDDATVTVDQVGDLEVTADPGVAGENNDFTYSFNASDIDDDTDIVEIFVDFDEASGVNTTEIVEDDVTIETDGAGNTGADSVEAVNNDSGLVITVSDNFVLQGVDGDVDVLIDGVDVPNDGTFTGELEFRDDSSDVIASGTGDYTIDDPTTNFELDSAEFDDGDSESDSLTILGAFLNTASDTVSVLDVVFGNVGNIDLSNVDAGNVEVEIGNTDIDVTSVAEDGDSLELDIEETDLSDIDDDADISITIDNIDTTDADVEDGELTLTMVDDEGNDIAENSTATSVAAGTATVAFVDNDPQEYGVDDAATTLDSNLGADFDVEVVDATETDLIAEMSQYDVLAVNHFGGTDVSAFLDELGADQGVVYLDNWDDAANGVTELADARNDIDGVSDETGGDPVFYEALETNHPLFAGVTFDDEPDVDDGVVIGEDWFGAYLEFTTYGGDVVGNVGAGTETVLEPGVGVDDNEVLLASSGFADFAPFDEHSDDSLTILANAVEFANEA